MARKNVSANRNERSGSVKMAMDGGEWLTCFCIQNICTYKTHSRAKHIHMINSLPSNCRFPAISQNHVSYCSVFSRILECPVLDSPRKWLSLLPPYVRLILLLLFVVQLSFSVLVLIIVSVFLSSSFLVLVVLVVLGFALVTRAVWVAGVGVAAKYSMIASMDISQIQILLTSTNKMMFWKADLWNYKSLLLACSSKHER